MALTADSGTPDSGTPRSGTPATGTTETGTPRSGTPATAPPEETGTPREQWLVERGHYEFEDLGFLDRAMAHRSWCAEQPERTSNERLEFLGDAVLGLVVAEFTYRNWPDLTDGQMSQIRAAVVNARVLAAVGAGIGVAENLQLGRGEDLSGGRAKESILADATEAVIGAVYLDGGLEEARRFVLSLLSERIAVAVGGPGNSDHKSRLQEDTVHRGKGVPHYELESFGPDHARHYRATVYVAGQRLGTGEGRSKKDAEQEAARAAYGVLLDEKVEKVEVEGGNA
jgi:ribonuclease III